MSSDDCAVVSDPEDDEVKDRDVVMLDDSNEEMKAESGPAVPASNESNDIGHLSFQLHCYL